MGIPALAGLSVMHGLAPPHPGPLIAINALNANLGQTLGVRPAGGHPDGDHRGSVVRRLDRPPGRPAAAGLVAEFAGAGTALSGVAAPRRPAEDTVAAEARERTGVATLPRPGTGGGSGADGEPAGAGDWVSDEDAPGSRVPERAGGRGGRPRRRPAAG